YLQRGDARYKAGEYKDAILNYQKAIQKDVKLGEAYYGLGLAQIKTEEYQKAWTAIEQAAALLPNRMDVKATLADILVNVYQADPQNRSVYDSISKISTDLLRNDPNSFDGLRIKGTLALLDRKPDQAVESLRAAHQINPSHEYLALAYSQALIQIGQAPEAE